MNWHMTAYRLLLNRRRTVEKPTYFAEHLKLIDSGHDTALALDNFGRCIRAAAEEFARIRHTAWVLYGWPK